MLRKRKRQPPAEGDIRDAVSAVVERALAWRDPCGKAYRVFHRVSVADARATLELGRRA